MAVQYIPKNPSTPLPLPAVRRSTRHIALPPTPSSSTALTITSTSSSPNGKNSRVVVRSPSTNPTRRKTRQPLVTTSLSSPTTPTPTSVSGSRSRKRSRFQDEPDQKEQDLAVESFPPTPSPRTRLGTIIDNRAPITPEPTPRAIRAQKRRKLTDRTAEADAEPNPASASPSSSSSSLSSLSSSHSLSPTTPHPQPISPEPISPEPISPTHLGSSYIVKSKSKSRPRKRKLEDDGLSSITSSSGDTPTPPASGDPLPRSLAKRRKLDRATTSRRKPPRSVRIRSKSKSSISSGTPPTPLTSSKKRTSPILRPGRPRSSVPLPRGGDNTGNDHRRNVRRSARLLVHTSDESRHQFPSDAQLEESLPLSPLTPPPSEDDASESGHVTDNAIEQSTELRSSSETLADPLAEEEDDTEMEMIACIGDVPTKSSSTFPSAAHTPTSPPNSWIIPSHISNPVLKGRPPPNPALYAQLQLASYRRTKPNTPSPLSLYSYTGVTPPTSPGLSAATINSLDAIDDIPPLGETAAAEAIAAIAEGDATLVGLPEQLFHEQQQPQMQFYGQGYSQVESSQQHSLPGQVFEQHLHQPQSEYRPPANVAASSASSPETSNPPPLDMNFMMIDLQLQMQLQHMGMQGSASEGMQFGVDQLGFMMGGNAAEERNDRIPTTVHMQDVHLHQQPQNSNHQQQIMDVQPFGYPYFPTEQQGQMQQGSNQLYATQEYDGGSQSFQGQAEYQQHQAQRQFQDQHQPHHQEQPQAPSASSYEAFGGIQPYQNDSPQVYEHQQRSDQQPQQDFQQQQQQHGGDEAPPFAGSNLNVGYDAGAYQTPAHTSTSTPVTTTPTTSATAVAASIPTRATTLTPHYTLSMHNALLFFQQSHSRFHEDQTLLAHDAVEMHTRQLEEFQRDKEERKRRLKRTKLVRDLQVVPMGSGLGGSAPGIGIGAYSGVARARGLWAVACKARMFEVVRIYTPALIREVTEISAREYYRMMGLKYPPCRFALSRYRRRMRRGEDDMSISEDDSLVDRDCDPEQERGDVEGESDDGFDGLSSFGKKDDGDADGEEFRNEKIFDFELLDDDEEYEEDDVVVDEPRKQTEVDVDVDEEMDDDEEDEDDDDDDDVEDSEEPPESGVDLDLEAIRDPFFQPELSMRITPQEPTPSISGGVETAFYVPPPEVYAVPEQTVALCEDQTQDPPSETQPSSAPSLTTDTQTTASPKQNQKQKFMLFHRPVLPLPPPPLSTFRPAALKFYNIDPVHAGRGTPCVKERREMWAGSLKLSSLSFSVKQTRRIKDGSDGTSEAVATSGVTAWYGVQAATAKDGSSSTLSATEPGSDPCSEARSVPPATENDDSVFGDCVGTCCMNENRKGKMKAIEVEVGKEEGERKLEEELPRGAEEANGDDDGPSSTSTALPEQPIAQPSPQPTRHLTVEIPPAHPDRIPHRRRGILGRTELLKVYAPPSKSVPPILPLARRPPRPPPPPSLGLELGLDETEPNSVVRSLATHHPVVPYSWEQVAEAMEVLAYQGIDASVWVDSHGHPPSPSSPLSPSSLSSNGISGTEVQIQPTFNPSSSELSAALG